MCGVYCFKLLSRLQSFFFFLPFFCETDYCLKRPLTLNLAQPLGEEYGDNVYIRKGADSSFIDWPEKNQN